ncbi:MAG TPA: lipid II flippase Amj family protein [Candidatus Acidoferrum sp.]|nr:lipid II flippase Amj family protein [Candidatus Acidoferrum sp.]
MDFQLFVICALTFVIHLIGTLAFAVRIAGVRTRRIALSLSLFNVLVLVSRTAYSFQAPFLAKRIEENIRLAVTTGVLADFRWLLLTATLATLAGGLLIPTTQRIFYFAVQHFQQHRSVAKLLLHTFFKGGILQVREVMAVPSAANLRHKPISHVLSTRIIALNVFSVALWTVGVFASLYAGYLNPELRVTSSQLSAIINGVATIMMFILVDPQVSVMTDDVIEGKITEPEFRKAIVWLVGSRVAGTLLAQALFVPAAHLVVTVAELV